MTRRCTCRPPSGPLVSGPTAVLPRIEVDAAQARNVDCGVKILLAPFGTRGDVHPMIALAQRLDCEGHDVLIAGPPDYVAAAERRRLRYHAYGSAIDKFLADTAADYAGGPILRLTRP
jgi:Glycosyltransferase family 28 N-terminal domain